MGSKQMGQSVEPPAQPKAPPEGARRGRNAHVYDFRRPSRFSKEHLRTLQTIHEQFIRNVITALTTYLRLGVRVQLESVEQTTFYEYLDQLSNPTVVFVLRPSPLDGPIVLEISMSPIIAAIDRLCGGPGAAEGHPVQLTDIEHALLQPIGRQILRAFSEAWSASIPIKPTIEEILLNPRGIRAIASNEILALLVFEVGIGESTGTMTLCFPHTTLEPVMDVLHSQAWNATPHSAEVTATEGEIRSLLLQTPLDVSAILGELEIPTSSLLGLREGDVIRLPTLRDDNLTVVIAGRPLLTGQPGVNRGNLAIRVNGNLDPRQSVALDRDG